MPEPVRVAVFASGSGTNLQALLDHQDDTTPWRVVLVVSDRGDAQALERARAARIDAVTISVKGRDPAEVSAETLALLWEHHVGLVALAGYLRLIPAEVVAAYRDRILNIHPAPLPDFGGPGMYGKRVHQAVIAAGARESGPTVHVVDEAYDRGRVLAHRRVPVVEGDDAEALAARVLEVEHELYPAVLDHVCAGLQRGEEPTPLPEPGTTSPIEGDEDSR